ncbi:3' terminal RNA ribose 2'-O-methyltransferase Hen1 [Pimelobacter simplex]|uniref:Small RNA 2'-O-methyltransferase n=1 Tax=Nocardioides simplex TaxID=2045 RepID=A0A0A1DJY7_NOCSI|nr:3' terminal RNA ribose 2'-O-methyltransferase Hen1 [Pimelobacter simplex]AIY16937.1 HEN1 C-terminal domain [Pimelobacter simplex]MCG8152083.1 3' terminal RNA ribose 2'-O-methyltransferase Hen1 [Pimelobacter simplex]GEB12836.1 3' terminal RNA ribose 2'-O-methyltransferase Hen1 [Pimelobacter simplex]SFM53517.1 3' terminal RNA ribose 2'-O-methyltransferase Hen1 [Pimelobacter simplex]
MLLTISTTHRPATDLGFLLHKHPDRVQEFSQSFGTATVFYPEASDERCTAALLLEVDPVRLARRSGKGKHGKGTPDFSLGQYVNDRSYAASSLFGVALADVFSTARSGRCVARPELADTAIPLELAIPALPCRGGVPIARRLFEPLGWTVAAEPVPLDAGFPEWGDSRYLDLTLTGTVRLADALSQLHVLLPVLDESKHYWQGPDEVDKLLRSGAGWLAEHPDRELVVRRYLGRRGRLVGVALERLAEVDDVLEPAGAETEPADVEEVRVPLNTRRHEAVLALLAEIRPRSVIDLGCGPGRLVERLLATEGIARVAGCDVSARSLQGAARRLHVDRMTERQQERLTLFQSALTYDDPRLAGYDVAVLMEVIEHVDPPRLDALERVVLGSARPGVLVVTTPNREYNVRYEGLRGMRHPDHRFEWDRAELRAWAERVGAAYGYTVELRGVGDDDPEVGTPTQMAILTRTSTDGASR